MLFKPRWRTSTLCLTVMAIAVVIVVMNLLDIPFVLLDRGLNVSPEQLVSPVSHAIVIPEVEVYTFQESTSWTRDTNVCASIHQKVYHGDFFRVPLESQIGSLSVFIHDPNKDSISKRIYKEKTWEPGILNVILLFLRADEDTNFIDIGANMGLHSLQIAKYGRKVLAIEASQHNVEHICASTYYGSYQDYLKIIYNAAGRDHTPSDLIVGRYGDLGGNYINSSQLQKLKQQVDGKFAYSDKPVTIPTVMLDDLMSWQYFETFKKSFIKIDVDGSEHLVMEGAKTFLTKSTTKGIIMEWNWHRDGTTADYIINLMKSFKFQPYDFSNTKVTRKKFFSKDSITKLFMLLNTTTASSWPPNILWLPDTVL